MNNITKEFPSILNCHSLAVAPERILKWVGGHMSGAKHRDFLSCLSTFFGSTSTISRFGERFRDGQYRLVSFLFSVHLLTVPPVLFVK